MSLNDALATWAKSPAGKAKIKSAQNEAAKTGKGFGIYNGKPGGTATQGPEQYANEAIAMMKTYIEAAGFEYGDYLRIVGAPRWDESIQKWEVHLEFDPDKIYRDSLDPKKYPEGAYDIVALMNHGYRAKHITKGYWDKAGMEVFSLQQRNGSYFIQYGAQAFNDRFVGQATMDWNPKYDA